MIDERKFSSRQPETRFAQCDGCGAYRAKRQNPEKSDEWVWAGGCRACDRIRHLNELLAAGVKVIEGPSSDTLRKKLQIADERVSKLETKLARRERELEKARRRVFKFGHDPGCKEDMKNWSIPNPGDALMFKCACGFSDAMMNEPDDE